MTIATRCKGLLLGGLLCLSTWALALPSPKDIEAAVQAGQFDRAESQLREVLREKPSSARAHYELGQVLAREGRYLEAEQSLRQAQKLEPSLKFASSPQQFNDLLSRLQARTRTSSASLSGDSIASPAPASAAQDTRPRSQQLTPTSQTQPAASFPWGWLLLGGGALAAAALWMRRAATAQRLPPPPVPSPLEAQGFGRSYGPAPAYHGPYPGIPAGTPASGSGTGSTMTSAVVGGIAGVAAGYALSKMLEGDHQDAPQSHSAGTSAGTGLTPIDEMPARPDFGSFDSGSGAGDGWDNADSGGGDSDGW